MYTVNVTRITYEQILTGLRVPQGPKSAVWLRIWYRAAAKGAGYVAVVSFRCYVVAFRELFSPVRATYVLF